MLKKLLTEIVISIAGKQAEQIVDLLEGEKYVNEFIIAKKLNLTINQTRNILYKISDVGLVSFIRKKDKRKGWYTYFWKIEIMKSLEFLKSHLQEQMNEIKKQIKIRETKEFYACELCNIEFSEESALINNFTCNECGNIVSRKDNAQAVKELNKEFSKLQKELDLVEEEIKMEREKIDKKRAKEVKKEEKKKAEEKEKMKKKRKSEKEKAKPKKTAKKIVKKTAKKNKK